MNCPKCKSEDVRVQIVSEEVVRVQKHGIIYNLFIGWWLRFFLFILTFPFKVLGMFLPKFKKYSNTEHKTMAVCQNCGHTWKVKGKL